MRVEVVRGKQGWALATDEHRRCGRPANAEGPSIRFGKNEMSAYFPTPRPSTSPGSPKLPLARAFDGLGFCLLLHSP